MITEKEFDKICDLYVKEQAFWVMSGRDEKEIDERKENFMRTYQKEISEYMLLYYEKINDQKGSNYTLTKELQDQGFTQDWLMLLKDYSESKIFGYDTINKLPGVQGKNEIADPDAKEQALRKFHAWIYRNADKTGFETLGSKGSPREFLEHNFMRADREIQKLTLFYLEKDIRKYNGDYRNSNDVINQYKNYTPSYENIRTIMRGTWMKFWKRQDGSYLYWNKLKDAFLKAKEDYEYQHGPDFREANDDIVIRAENNKIKNPVHGQTTTETVMSLNKEINDDITNEAMLNKCVMTGMNLGYGVSNKLNPVDILLGGKVDLPDAKQPYNAKIKGYEGGTDIVGSAVKTVVTGKAAYDNFMEGVHTWNEKNGIGTTADFSNAGMNGGFAVNGTATFCKSICDVVTAATKTQKMVEDGVKVTAETAAATIGKIAGIASLVASAFKTVAGFFETIKFGKGISEAKKAREIAKQIQGKDTYVVDEFTIEGKKAENRAEFIENSNFRKLLGSALPKFAAGLLGVAAAAITVFTLGAAPAVVAGIGLATGIFFFLGEKLAGLWPSRKNKREAVDTELMENSEQGKENIEKAFAKNRQKAFLKVNGDPERKSVVEKIKANMNVTADENGDFKLSSKKFGRHVGNINRRNVEADNGLMNHDEAYSFVKGKIAKEAMEKIYGSKQIVADWNNVDTKILKKKDVNTNQYNYNKAILESMNIKSEKSETADIKNTAEKTKKINAVKNVGVKAF